MEIIKTKSFGLAVNSKGNKNAEKLAIVLPGRLDTKDYECFNLHLELLASKGFFAVCFDPPGTWESVGGTELFTTTNYIKAIDELINHFDNRRTFLMGHSRGGQVAMLAGAMNPKVISFAIINGSLGAPTPPDEKLIKNGTVTEFRDLPPGTSKTKVQKEFHLSLNYFKDGEQYDVISILQECAKPKLFVYGTRDEFTESEEVKEVFSKVPEPKELHWLDTNHDYRYRPKIVQEVNRLVGQFLDKF